MKIVAYDEVQRSRLDALARCRAQVARLAERAAATEETEEALALLVKSYQVPRQFTRVHSPVNLQIASREIAAAAKSGPARSAK